MDLDSVIETWTELITHGWKSGDQQPHGNATSKELTYLDIGFPFDLNMHAIMV